MALTHAIDAEERLSAGQVIDRVAYLVRLHEPTRTQRSRMRSIQDGGVDAVWAILGDKLKDLDELTPIPPLLVSGMSKLGQKIGGQVPRLKVPVYERQKDSRPAKENAELRKDIVEAYDDGCRMEMQLPQVGRWLPGYGYFVWIVRDGYDDDGSRFPLAELRDPYDCYPGIWGVHQQPREMAVLYTQSPEALHDLYPDLEMDRLRQAMTLPRGPGGSVLLTPSSAGAGSWANQVDAGVVVAEYWCPEGTYVVLPDVGVQVDFSPNPIFPHNRFVVGKRFAFNRLVGAYDHIVGLASMMAKIDILQYIFMEDSVMTETNVIGDGIDRRQYQRGRGATNVFPAGTQIVKPISNMPYQVFQLVDRIERRLRIGASYPVSDDSQAPVSYLTGRGLESLQETRDSEIAEYHKVIRWALQDLDTIRLRWDEARGRGARAPVGYRDGKPFVFTYTPAVDIAGRYKTRRKHGFMAGWDDSTKIVGGLQLMQADALDVETFQENIDGLDNMLEVNNRVRRRSATGRIYELLSAQAADPSNPQLQAKATMALIEIVEHPERFEDILRKHFTPQTPQYTPEEEAFLAGQGGMPGAGGALEMPQMPPDITTVLSQLPAGGAPAEGGVQTVGRL